MTTGMTGTMQGDSPVISPPRKAMTRSSPMEVARLRSVSGHRRFSFWTVSGSNLVACTGRGVSALGVTAGPPHSRLWNGDQRELDLPGHRNRRGGCRRIPAGHPAGNDAAQSGGVAALGCPPPCPPRRRAEPGPPPAPPSGVHGGLHAVAHLHRLLPQLRLGVE